MFRFLSYETQSESFNCWATGLSYSMDECTRPCEIYILIQHRQFSCLSRFFFLQLNSLVISHFRKQIMSPFLAINAVGDYDVRSEVLGGGHSGEKFRPLVSLHFDFSLWLVYKTRAIDFLDQSNVRRRQIATWSLACLARQAIVVADLSFFVLFILILICRCDNCDSGLVFYDTILFSCTISIHYHQ